MSSQTIGQAFCSLASKQQTSMVQFDDLSDDCLMEVLERVSLNQLFKLQRLNKRMKRLATIKIGVKIEAIQIEENSRSLFSSCSHFDSISSDQILVLKYYFTYKLMNSLSKCSSVKAVDYGNKLRWFFFFKAFQRCPDLECVKLSVNQFSINQDEWEFMLDEIGHRIVHLALRWNGDSTTSGRPLLKSDRFLATVAEKCRNSIKRLDWVHIDYRIQSDHADLMTKFKLLPKSCWIRFFCIKLSADFTVEDGLDELDVACLNWQQLGHRYDRLSTLRFYQVEGPVHAIEFNGLKRLDFNGRYGFISESIDHLLVCRFPKLEESCFSAIYSEEVYQAMFQRIRTVKKLIIINVYLCGRDWVKTHPKLPQLAAIHKLKNLETIDLIITKVENEWQPNDFLQQIEEYVGEVSSLKKVTIDIQQCKNEVWNAAVEQLVKRLKVKQSRVEVVLVLNKDVNLYF